MPIGISEEHEALRSTARRWVESRCPASVPRSLLDRAPGEEGVPEFWAEIVAQGWIGLHVPEDRGGEGFGYAELAVVLEELGRAVAPGPFLPTVSALAVLAEADPPSAGVEGLMPAVVDGSSTAAIVLEAPDLVAAGQPDTGVRLSGVLRPVLCGPAPALVVVAAGGSDRWCVIDTAGPGVRCEPVAGLDPTRGLVAVHLQDVDIAPERCFAGPDRARALDLVATLAAAEMVGVAGWCLDTAASYAKVREQFGRPIGQFQGVKHKLADLLIVIEQARAATWDAALALDERRSGQDGPDAGHSHLPTAVAASLAFDGACRAAKDCVQTLGGVGYTWEHDAHLYLKRAMAVRQMLGGGGKWRAAVARLSIGGARRSLRVELPAAAEDHRHVIREACARIKALPRDERRRALADEGFIAPHWPAPWGRGAGPAEQVVVDQELAAAGIRVPHLAVGAWALPTIIVHGTREQQERFVRPTLYGELAWCQMFSEPGAGSDLASLSTKAVRVEGGWSISGQKVWTSMARDADWAICLARTNPSAPKHQGITYFLLDVRSEGVDIRPLRELTGHEWFNEVFLSDVFVPDDCVVGAVDDGWRLARTTLANERVSMGSGASYGVGVEAVLEMVGGRPDLAGDALVADQLGGMLVEAQSLALLSLRTTLRALSGADPGPEASVRKLLGVEHEQRVQEFGLGLLGAEGATTEGEAGGWTYGFLANRCLTIAGGTSEVQRNIIAERILGLPRDPEPGA
ncbi:MAG: acyl-CoA dehydrogenase [Acidimicrobiales bacterium]